MSVETEPADLASALREYDLAYLITLADRERAHVVAVTATLEGGQIIVNGLGRRSMTNAAARAFVTLLWPPATPEDHSLIVDGNAEPRGDGLLVSPTRAVLHRSPSVPAAQAQAAAPGACASDCVELSFGVS